MPLSTSPSLFGVAVPGRARAAGWRPRSTSSAASSTGCDQRLEAYLPLAVTASDGDELLDVVAPDPQAPGVVVRVVGDAEVAEFVIDESDTLVVGEVVPHVGGGLHAEEVVAELGVASQVAGRE